MVCVVPVIPRIFDLLFINFGAEIVEPLKIPRTKTYKFLGRSLFLH